MSDSVPMSVENGIASTISKLIDSNFQFSDDDDKRNFLKVITSSKDIPLSKLDKDDLIYFENTIRYLISLYNSNNELTDEQYIELQALELSSIARIKRAHDGFERKSLNKQIQERRNVNESGNNSSSILSKLFGSKSKKQNEVQY